MPKTRDRGDSPQGRGPPQRVHKLRQEQDRPRLVSGSFDGRQTRLPGLSRTTKSRTRDPGGASQVPSQFVSPLRSAGASEPTFAARDVAIRRPSPKTLPGNPLWHTSLVLLDRLGQYTDVPPQRGDLECGPRRLYRSKRRVRSSTKQPARVTQEPKVRYVLFQDFISRSRRSK